MHRWFTRRLGAAVLAIGVLSLACSGDRGPQGPSGTNGDPGASGATGTTGPTGPQGQPGATSGTVNGRITDALTATTNVAGATVVFDPGAISVLSNTDGVYTAELPPGVYSATLSATGYADETSSNIAVLGGQTVTKNFSLQPLNLLVANAGPMKWQAGFGVPVMLDGTASSGPAGMTLSYSWRQLSGPVVTLAGADTATPSFTTKTLDALVAAEETQFRLPTRTGPIGFTGRDAEEMTYTFELTVSALDGAFQKKAQVQIQSVSAQGGLDNVPINLVTHVNGPVAGSYSWSCAVLDGAVETPCAAGVLGNATSRVASFQPKVEGEYLLREATLGAGNPIHLYAGTFIGSSTAGVDRARCQACHARDIQLTDGLGHVIRTITDKFGPWSATKHASTFQRAVDGDLSAHYGGDCNRCHTTGFNGEAANGGFDDVAAELGWTMPAQLQPGNYAAMPARLKSLANVGCENCHGPGSQHASFSSVQSIGKSYNAVDCNQCHQNAPYQVQGVEWAISAHARFVENLEAGDPALSGSCASCHSTQGFIAWTRNPDGGVAATPPPSVDTAEPQTCATCHDPHSVAKTASGDPAPHLLRIYDNVNTLVGGGTTGLPIMGARSVGAGAICMACHNSRKVFSATSQSAPHGPTQTDILLAKNAATFDGGTYPTSPHATVPDACVGCHMAPTPSTGPGSHKVGGHTFAVKDEESGVENIAACTSCHQGLEGFNRTAYSDFDGDGLVSGIQDEVVGLLTIVQNAMTTKAVALYGALDASLGATPTVLTSHGSIRLLRTYTPGSACDPIVAGGAPAGNDCYAFSVDGGAPTKLPVTTDDQKSFVGAAWNWFLISQDGSLGIHNPAYAVSVLQRSYKMLTGNEVPNATIRR